MSQLPMVCDGETLTCGMTTQTPKEEGYNNRPTLYFCDKSRRWKKVRLFDLKSLIHSWQLNTFEDVVDSRRKQRNLQKLKPEFSAMSGILVFLANKCWCSEGFRSGETHKTLENEACSEFNTQGMSTWKDSSFGKDKWGDPGYFHKTFSGS